MKLIVLIFAATIFCFSCKPKETQPGQKVIPAPLQEKSTADFILSKSSRGDLVELLYNELEKNNPQLKEISDLINSLRNRKGDSLEVFSNFDEKNNNYYFSAKNHLQSITDSTLKKNMEELITNSMKNYDSKMLQLKELKKIMDDKNTKINDLLNVLKITKTLPLINDYQQSAKVPLSPLQNINKESDNIISKEEKLIKN